jgi:hypothetical protein
MKTIFIITSLSLVTYMYIRQIAYIIDKRKNRNE